MDRFIARENVKHFRNRLDTELDPDVRSKVRRLLIEEEDKLGASLELLADIDRHIEAGHRRVERQQLLVTTMERDGHASATQARCLLDGLLESLELHQQYRHQTWSIVRLRQERL